MPTGPVLVSFVDGAGAMTLYVDGRGGVYVTQLASPDESFEMLIVGGRSYLRSAAIDSLRWVSLGERTIWSSPDGEVVDDPVTPEGLAYDDLVVSAHGFRYRDCLEAGFPVELSSSWEWSCPDEVTLTVEVDDELRPVRTSTRDRYHIFYEYPSSPSGESVCAAVCPEAFAEFAPLSPPSSVELLAGAKAEEIYVDFHSDYLRRAAYLAFDEISSVLLYGHHPLMSIVEFNEYIAVLVARLPISSYADVSVRAVDSDLFSVTASSFGVTCERVVRLVGFGFAEESSSCAGSGSQ